MTGCQRSHKNEKSLGDRGACSKQGKVQLDVDTLLLCGITGAVKTPICSWKTDNIYSTALLFVSLTTFSQSQFVDCNVPVHSKKYV